VSVAAVLGSFIAHMSGADFFGLIVSVLVIAYLFYALIRGERL
jgi:K+-transporting ATPase KdpF subunit